MSKKKPAIEQTRIEGTVEPGQVQIEAAVDAYEGAMEVAKSAADARKEKRLELLLVMDAFERESVTVNGKRWFPKSTRTVGSCKVPRAPKAADVTPGREKIEFEHRKNAAIADLMSGRSKVAADAAAKASNLSPELLDKTAEFTEKLPDGTTVSLRNGITLTKAHGPKLRAAAKALRKAGGRS